MEGFAENLGGFSRARPLMIGQMFIEQAQTIHTEGYL
jgi:hypothetical protein